MRFIKLILISTLVFFLLITGISLLIPSHVRISRAIDIKANKSQVLPYITNLSEWQNWNQYIKEGGSKFDVSLDKVTDSLVTSNWAANGKKFSSGMALLESFEGTATVQWYFDFKLNWYPWEKFGSIIYDRQMGSIMEERIENLKSQVESN